MTCTKYFDAAVVLNPRWHCDCMTWPAANRLGGVPKVSNETSQALRACYLQYVDG
jgi:hypothetical protein